MGTSAPPPRLVTALWFAVAGLLVVQVYLLLHELGHALAAVMVGGSVTGVDARFWSLRPHASYAFTDITSGQRAFVAAGGTLLPLVAWALAMIALPRRLPTHLGVLRLLASAALIGGSTPWLVLPWGAFHAATPGDDVVRFTRLSGWPPALVAAIAGVTLLAAAALLWWRAGGWEGLRALRAIRVLGAPPRALRLHAATLLALMLLAIGIDAVSLPRPSHDAVAVALPGGPAIGEVVLDGRVFDGELGRGVTDDGLIVLVIGFEDIAGGPFGLVLIDANGTERSLGGFGADTTMGVAASRPRLEVAEGAWVVRLWAEATVGRVRLWIEDPGAEGPPIN
jgi:hypothetical protein